MSGFQKQILKALELVRKLHASEGVMGERLGPRRASSGCFAP